MEREGRETGVGRAGWLMLLVAGALLGGCATEPPMPEGIDAQQREMIHGYSLLYTLVSKNSGVDTILVMRGASEETKRVINDIAKSCDEMRQTLEGFAEGDTWLQLENSGLPVIEQATRSAVEVTTTKQLTFGDKFELRLLLTQTEALGYGEHLARELAEREKSATRRKALVDFADKAGALRKRVLSRLTPAS